MTNRNLNIKQFMKKRLICLRERIVIMEMLLLHME